MTAVEWFYEQIIQKDNLNTIRLGGTKVIDKLYLQAKEIEESQAIPLPEGPQGKDMPVLSDNEIRKIATDHVLYNDSKREWIITGMKMYREVLQSKK